MTLEILVEKSMSRLKKLDEDFVSRGYKPLVLFSGGKDSLVVLDLCHKYFGSDMYVGYIHIPGNTHEECDNYVFEVVEKYLGDTRRLMYMKREKVKVRGREVTDFFEVIRYYGIPMNWRNRWCMTLFKFDVLKQVPPTYVFIAGAKQSDTNWRRLYLNATFDGFMRSWIHRHVSLELIYDWSKEHVKEYIKQNNLKINPLYDKIGHSGNCMFCPAYLTSVDRILTYLNRLEKWCREWYSKIIHYFKLYMEFHRREVKCSLKCSKCPYLKDRNKFPYAKRIGIVLEILNEKPITAYLQQ